jgi:hypothetical protein
MKLNMNIERQITEGRKGGLEHGISRGITVLGQVKHLHRVQDYPLKFHTVFVTNKIICKPFLAKQSCATHMVVFFYAWPSLEILLKLTKKNMYMKSEIITEYK